MKNNLNIFEKFLFEAPGDDPPDLVDEQDTAPQVEEEASDDSQDESPPDLSFDDVDDSPATEDDNPDGTSANDGEQPSGLDEKISAVMNMNLYQRFLSLLNNIENQIFMIKNNSDILYTISNNSLNILSSLRKLDENVRLYLTHYFVRGNYSKNLLFFNKCLNLLKLLNNIFDKEIRGGIKNIE